MKQNIIKNNFIKKIFILSSIFILGCTLQSTPYKMDTLKADENIVQLRYATLPSPLTPLAIHYWFVVYNDTYPQGKRWEVWQNKNVSGESWEHVHKGLKHPDAGVGGGSYQIDKVWHGQKAKDIIAVLEKPLSYPYYQTYKAWPGPNSNTYVAWVLRQAKVSVDMHPKAIGKDYLGIVGVDLSTSRTGVQIESPLVGLKLGLKDGIELHLLCLTTGVDVYPLALKTPLGRIGFTEYKEGKAD